jgi:hypothetical protein
VHRDLAANIGINFKTPEEYFLDLKTEPYSHVFDPSTYLKSADDDARLVSAPFIKGSRQELVIFCGSPGAGKSTFFWNGKLSSTTFARIGELDTGPRSCFSCTVLTNSTQYSPAASRLRASQPRYTEDGEWITGLEKFSPSLPLSYAWVK